MQQCLFPVQHHIVTWLLIEEIILVQLVEETRNIVHKFSGKWIRNGFIRKRQGHVICNSGAGTQNQFNQSKDKQTTSFSQMQSVWDKGKDSYHTYLVSGFPKLVRKQYKRRRCCQKISLGMVYEAWTGKLRQVV